MEDVTKMLADHFSKAELEKCTAPQKLHHGQPKGAEQKERPRTHAAETLQLSRPSLYDSAPPRAVILTSSVRNSAAARSPRARGVCEIVHWPQVVHGQLPTLSLNSPLSHAAHTTETFFRSSLPQGYEPPPPNDVLHAPHPRRRQGSVSSLGGSARY